MMIMQSVFVVAVVCLVAAQGLQPEAIEKRRTKSDFTFGNQHFNNIDEAVGFFARSRRDSFVVNGKVDGKRIDVHEPSTPVNSSSKAGSFLKDLLGLSKDSKDTSPLVIKSGVVNGDQVNSRKRRGLVTSNDPVTPFDRRTAFVVNAKVDGDRIGGIKSDAKGEGASQLKAALNEVKNSTSF